MRTVPLRRTVQCNIVDPIFSFYKAWCSKDLLLRLREYLEVLQSFRDSCVRSLTNDSATDDDLSALIPIVEKWLSAVLLLESVLPFGDCADSAVALSFSWTDPYNPSRANSFYSIEHEKLAVLFNLAALHATAAFAIDHRKSTEARKEALQQFQRAAGIFKHVADVLDSSSPTALPSEYRKTVLKLSLMLEAVMSAQAQTCVYEKAVADKLSRSLLSKLAHQIANFYATALQNTKDLESLPLTLPNWFEVQRLAFLAASHYQRSNHELVEVRRRSEGYGAIIARLRVANELCHEAEKAAAEASDVLIDISELQSACKTLLKELEHDNRTVYLEMLPNENSLPPLESVSAVQAIPFNPPSLVDIVNHGHDISFFFTVQLTPPAVTEAIEHLETKVEHLAAPLIEKVALLREDFDRFRLSDTVLYIVIEADTDDSRFPDVLWTKIAEIQKQGGESGIQSGIRATQVGVRRCQAIITSIEETLLLGDHECSIQKGPTITTLQTAVERYKKKLSDAGVANKIIESVFNSTLPHHSYFVKSREELESCLPAPIKYQSKTQEALQKLAHVYNETNDVVKLMEAFTSTYQRPWKPNSVTVRQLHKAAFQRCPLRKITDLFIQDFTEQLKEKHSLLERGQKTFESLKNMWEVHASDISPLTTSQRTQFLQALDSAVIDTLQTFRDIKEGLDFYSSLSGHLTHLNQQVDAWNTAHRHCYAYRSSHAINDASPPRFSVQPNGQRRRPSLSLIPLSCDVRTNIPSYRGDSSCASSRQPLETCPTYPSRRNMVMPDPSVAPSRYKPTYYTGSGKPPQVDTDHLGSFYVKRNYPSPHDGQ